MPTGRPDTLPQPRTPTYGREQLCGEVAALLSDGSSRLVTLTGLGGSGKTRVALVVARTLRDGGRVLHFVVLTEQATEEWLREQLAGAGPDDLVVLDNVEVVEGFAEVLGALLAEEGPSYLVTSRVPLRVPGEHEVQVPPLALPVTDRPEAVAAAPAVQLFVAAVRRTAPDFELSGDETEVAALCRLLDGVPLALELAAARVKVLGLRRVHDGLRQGLELLSTSSQEVPERQRALTTTIRWSVERLGEPQRRLVERLAVFEGRFSLDAVLAVAPGDASVADQLGDLMDAGLLRAVTVAGEQRYLMPTTVRGFAREHRRGDVVDTREALGAFLLSRVREVAARLDTANGEAALAGFAEDSADVEGTVDWALAAGRIALATDLVLASARPWVSAGHARSALLRTTTVRGYVAAESPEAGRLRTATGYAAYHLGDWDTAGTELQAARTIAERHQDVPTAAAAGGYLGATLLMTGELDEGARLAGLAQDVAERLDLYPLAAEMLSVIAISHAMRGETALELSTHEARLAMVRRHGDVGRTADALNTLAEIALDLPDAETAAAYAEESLRMTRDRLPLEARDAMITLARAALVAGDVDTASSWLGEALAAVDATGQSMALAQSLRVGACLALAHEDPGSAVRLFAAAQSVSPSPNGTDVPVEFDLATALGEARQALGPAAAQREWTLGTAASSAAARRLLESQLTRARG